MNKTKTNPYYYALIAVGILGLAIFIRHMVGFKFPYYAYENLVQPYIGTNIVSMWTDLCFFTYWSLILFSVWLIFYGLTNLFNWKLKSLVNNNHLVASIISYQVAVIIIYTLFELGTGMKFGWYANTLNSWLNVVENIVVHFIYVGIAVLVWLKHKVNAAIKPSKKTILLFLSFPILFYITTSIICAFFMPIQWYPYAFYTPKTMWFFIFKNFENFNFILGLLLLIITLIIVFLSFVLIYLFLIKLKNKSILSNKSHSML